MTIRDCLLAGYTRIRQPGKRTYVSRNHYGSSQDGLVSCDSELDQWIDVDFFLSRVVSKDYIIADDWEGSI